MKWPFVVGEMIANAQQRKKTFEKNIFNLFFSKGHLFVIFVVLQIKIIHVSMSRDRTIDRNNPVENSSRGHPPHPSEISTL